MEGEGQLDLKPGQPGYFEHTTGFWLLMIAFVICLIGAETSDEMFVITGLCIVLVSFQFLDIRDSILNRE
jgi:hypothetical protein